MAGLEDIRYNPNYALCTTHFLALNDENFNREGPTPPTLVPNASFLSFLRFFNDLFGCDQHIDASKKNMIQLAVSAKSFRDWNTEINVMKDNIRKIYIFCDSYSNYMNMRSWRGSYRNRIRHVCWSNELDELLLKKGLDYVHEAVKEFRDDPGIRNQFRADACQLLTALSTLFQDEADALSTEATDQWLDTSSILLLEEMGLVGIRSGFSSVITKKDFVNRFDSLEYIDSRAKTIGIFSSLLLLPVTMRRGGSDITEENADLWRQSSLCAISSLTDDSSPASSMFARHDDTEWFGSRQTMRRPQGCLSTDKNVCFSHFSRT